MNTEVTRGPRVCPSCGRENPPEAAHCSGCLAPLEATVQVGRSPAWDVGLSPIFPDEDAPPRRLLPGWARAVLFAGGAALVVFSGVITFFAVCTATAALAPVPVIETALAWGASAGTLAALAVVLVLLVALRRFWRR